MVVLAVMVLAHYAPEPRTAKPVPGIDDSTWIENFSIAKYKPLLRLVSGTDEQYVASHLGNEAASAYRKVRRSLIREYLRSLSRDFNRIHAIATAKATRAPEDQGNLPFTLMEQQMSFIFQVWTIEARLLLGPLAPCRIELQAILSHIDAMAAQTRLLTRPQLSYQVM